MLRIIDELLNLGTAGKTELNELRRIRSTNLLNSVVVCYLLVSLTKYFILREHFNPAPSLLFMIPAVASLLLNYLGRTRSSFFLFAMNTNLCVWFFNMYYPEEAGMYLFYFPLAVSVVLLNNPSERHPISIMYPAIFLCCFSMIFIDLPGLRLAELTPFQVKSLWYYDLAMTVAVTLVLSFLLARELYEQNREISVHNEKLVKTQERLNITLKEKDILLTEFQHRTKNNLAILSSLLNLQESSALTEEMKQLIIDNKNRIQSMALVQKMLFETPVAGNIDLASYASQLVNELFIAYNLSSSVTVLERYDQVTVPASKSVPLGLILNEILTNSIKYVYKGRTGSRGVFSITLKAENGNMAQLTIKDSGHGFPHDFNQQHESPSLGIFLIKTLAAQIDGNVRFSNDQGAKIELTFACL